MSLALYMVEAGLLLAISPWTTWWQRNYFAMLWPELGGIMSQSSVRWCVVSIGVVTTLAGMAELRSAILRRLAERRAADDRARRSE